MKLPDRERLVAAARAVRERGLWAPLDPRTLPRESAARFGALRVSGPGAAAFLDGQLSNLVAGLSPGAGNASARATRRGALSQLLTLHRLPVAAGSDEGFLLLMDREEVPALRADLEAYLFEDGIELRDESEHWRWWLLRGPRADELLRRAAPALPFRDLAATPAGAAASARASEPGAPHEPAGTGSLLPPNALRFATGSGPSDEALLVRRAIAGEDIYLLGLAKPEAGGAALIERLAGIAGELDLVSPPAEILGELLATLRVEAGLPIAGPDLHPGEDQLAASAWEDQLVHRDKGCYLGQEVIARLHSRGSAPLALRGLLLAVEPGEGDVQRQEDALRNLPDPGSPLLAQDGRRLGRVASAAYSPALAAPVLMALLDREHRNPGLGLVCQGKRDDFRAEVVLLPFVAPDSAETDAATLYERALQRFAARRDGEALALLEAVLRADPAHADAYEALGVILGRSERYAEAIALFERLERLAPEEPLVNSNLSLYAMKLGDKERAEAEKAKATVKQFKGLAREGVAAAQAEAEALAKRRETERRLEMFREVLAMDADDPLALGGLGRGLADLERWEEAEPLLARACAVQPDNAVLFEQWGRCLERLGRRDAARAAYRRGIASAARKGNLMPLRKMEQRLTLLDAADV